MFELLNTFGQREINKQKKIDISEKKTLVRSGWDMIHNPISIKSDKKVDLATYLDLAIFNINGAITMQYFELFIIKSELY